MDIPEGTLRSSPMSDFEPERSAAWQMFQRNLHTRLRDHLQLAFRQGNVGHCCRPLNAKEQRSLMAAMELHPSLLFIDKEGRTVGAMLCTCGPCEERYFSFVLETGIALRAQVAGQMSYFLRDGDTVQGEECVIGAAEEQLQLRIAKLAVDVAQQVSAEMGKRLETRIKAEVSLQLAEFFAAEARSGTAQKLKKQALITESFRQQADMMRGD
jgi:hypothetical protein